MPEDTLQRASLAYRNAQADIWAGHVPEKYMRLLPFIPGPRVLEIGAAEGVLALLLGRRPDVETVTALEWREERHREALRLQHQWAALGLDVARVRMLQGDIRERVDLLTGQTTVVLIRTLYYLRADAVPMLRAAWMAGIGTVVLSGNRGRQARYRRNPDDELGQFNHLAATEGMVEALTRAGFEMRTVLDEGDPIVVGCHPHRA